MLLRIFIISMLAQYYNFITLIHSWKKRLIVRWTIQTQIEYQVKVFILNKQLIKRLENSLAFIGGVWHAYHGYKKKVSVSAIVLS